MQTELARRDVFPPLDVIAVVCHEEIRHYVQHSDQASDEGKLLRLRKECASILGNGFRQRGFGDSLTEGDFLAVLMSSLQFRVYDDVLPTLAALKKLGVRLGVVSNWDCGLPEVLHRIGLSEFFDSITVSATCGFAKPAREIFEIALSSLAVSADRVVHVGDKWDLDVEGPRSAGVCSVFLRRDDRSVPTEHQLAPAIRSLTELTEMLSGARASISRAS